MTTFSKCHHPGTTPLFTHEGRTLYAVNSTGVWATPPADLIIDLAGIADAYGRSQRTFLALEDSTWAGAPALAALEAPPRPRSPILRLDWVDYDAPPDRIGVAWWRALWASLPQGRIVIGCIGSHGRTGTCLSALRIVLLGESVPNAVHWVRRHHCVNAVESEKQLTYLWRLSKTLGTHTQPYDQALADQLATATPPPAPRPPAAPTGRLESVTYHHRQHGLVTATAAEWLDDGYYTKEFKTHATTDSRLLRYA